MWKLKNLSNNEKNIKSSPPERIFLAFHSLFYTLYHEKTLLSQGFWISNGATDWTCPFGSALQRNMPSEAYLPISFVDRVATVSSPVSDIAHEQKKSPFSRKLFDCSWCNRLDLNQWPPPSQGGVLIQLNYGCKNIKMTLLCVSKYGALNRVRSSCRRRPGSKAKSLAF